MGCSGGIAHLQPVALMSLTFVRTVRETVVTLTLTLKKYLIDGYAYSGCLISIHITAWIIIQ